MNENSLKNIKPPQKGEIRNPKGKPKGCLNSKTILRKFLDVEIEGVNPFTKQKDVFTLGEILHLKQIERANNGDLASYREIMDRMEGKPMAYIEQRSEIQKITIVTSEADALEKLLDEDS